jgi:hypothetical protein
MEIDQTLLGAGQAFIAENVPTPPTYGTFLTPHLSLSQWRIGEMATNGENKLFGTLLHICFGTLFNVYLIAWVVDASLQWLQKIK